MGSSFHYVRRVTLGGIVPDLCCHRTSEGGEGGVARCVREGSYAEDSGYVWLSGLTERERRSMLS